jgi:hypothetical protein
LWLIVFWVSAAGGKPLTEAGETSAMSNTWSVPACEYPAKSITCWQRPGFFQGRHPRYTFKFATTVSL